MTIWRQNCAGKFEANKAVNDLGEFYAFVFWLPFSPEATYSSFGLEQVEFSAAVAVIIGGMSAALRSTVQVCTTTLLH
jgi:hypothetical protein